MVCRNLLVAQTPWRKILLFLVKETTAGWILDSSGISRLLKYGTLQRFPESGQRNFMFDEMENEIDVEVDVAVTKNQVDS